MKFTNIVRNKSTEEAVLLTTEPPLTKVVFDKFIERFKEDYRSKFAFVDGRLSYMASPSFGTGDVLEFEEHLEIAVYAIDEAKKKAERNSEAFLERISKQCGLPLEDDPPTNEIMTDPQKE